MCYSIYYIYILVNPRVRATRRFDIYKIQSFSTVIEVWISVLEFNCYVIWNMKKRMKSYIISQEEYCAHKAHAKETWVRCYIVSILLVAPQTYINCRTNRAQIWYATLQLFFGCIAIDIESIFIFKKQSHGCSCFEIIPPWTWHSKAIC